MPVNWYGKSWTTWDSLKAELMRRGAIQAGGAPKWLFEHPGVASALGVRSTFRPPSGGGGGGGGGPAPGAGATQNPGQAGGVWWGGSFYPTPDALRNGLFPTNDAAFDQFLDSHPSIKNWYMAWFTTGPGSSGGGGGSVSGGNDTSTTPGAFLDPNWLASFGLPPDVRAQVEDVFRRTPDVGQSTSLALALIRGTDWYRQTYPAINEGISRGLFGDERGYRAFANTVSNLYNQYLGRPASAADVSHYVASGATLEMVGRGLEARAYLGANRNQIQFLAGGFGGGQLTEEELSSFSRQQAGLGSNLGAQIQRRVERASEVVSRLFEGVLASPTLSLSGSGDLQATSLSGRRSRPDIGA